MKLAKIDHFRCGQPAGKWGLSTYVWVADEMTKEEFEAKCDEAAKKVLAYEAIVKDSAPVQPPGYGATITPNTPDHLTVGELKAEYETKAKAYKAHQEKAALGRKSFAQVLVDESAGKIKLFWNEPAPLSYDVEWGHHHGTTIEYGDTKLTDNPWQELDSEDDI